MQSQYRALHCSASRGNKTDSLIKFNFGGIITSSNIARKAFSELNSANAQIVYNGSQYSANS